ncbi:D-tagatose-bisphosphate aldolase, class II, non-catalytic subunit [Microbacterium sp. Leaf436]|uniref:D-tagatose-bisphosphate aldolase, class II, non-catalytic subunit n=1 Tax=Microbacterium sp. Leaf436 TaxID=1736377 RepID=UPI0007023073|nr:D-tagatose-bisphosphate aldolase, class II, non-catalytic subunit [Microbacterium sp. Leaf436]KQT71934.1 tagatose-bisphosphate aldolase [Microbacterium sp. Leaf436]
MTSPLQTLIQAHKSGPSRGIYAVCSAHPTVLRASLRQVREDRTPLLVEATSNQVDQFGGYTGRTPEQFRDDLFTLADEEQVPREQIILGGDHLGPNRWRDQGPAAAMELAEELVRSYVRAGYQKIHLDCSMACAGDTVPLADDTVADRAVRLMWAAEDEAIKTGIDRSNLVYVIGTEVPTPGGATETLEHLRPTSPDSARQTLEVHRSAVQKADLADAWTRVIALVVQPAVEFDHLQVVDYLPEATQQLRAILDDEPTLVFEAHSTDYQRPENLRALVEGNWIILKVGPGLTFALREALFALAAIEQEIVPADTASRLRAVIEEQMAADPKWWANYYEGDPHEQRMARGFSYSDRLRYYWPNPIINAAVTTLIKNLRSAGIPEPLLSQYLPAQYLRVRAGHLTADPEELVIDKVRDVLRDYAAACTPTGI